MDLLNRAEQVASSLNSPHLKLSIIKEMLHLDIITALAKSDINRELVFQGGTCLRLCHKGSRFSEDLDFVLANPSSEFNASLFKEFETIFIKSVKDRYNLEAEVTFPKDLNQTLSRWVAKVILPSSKAKINIEVCKVPSYDNSILQIRDFYNTGSNLAPFLLAESKEEILADKMVAFTLRNYLKARDLWDIKFLADYNVKLNTQLIKKKISDYGVNFNNFSKELEIRANNLNFKAVEADFNKEMSRFLPKDIYDDIIRFNYLDNIISAVKNYANEYLSAFEIKNPLKFDEKEQKSKNPKIKDKS